MFLCCVLFVLFGCSNDRPKLHLFVWADYLSPSLIERFEEQYHCQVVVNTFDSNEAMVAKLQLGGGGYDLIFPSNYSLEILVAQKQVERLDLSLLPNYENLDTEILNRFDAEQLKFGVPFSLSYGGVGYRKDRVLIENRSWDIFGNGRLRGRMTLLNDVREVFGAALKYLGYSLNSTNIKEIQEAGSLLKKWKKNLAKFESEQYKNGIATAEYLVSQGYSGDLLRIAEEVPEVSFYLPQEGASLSIDLVVIAKNAHQPKLAYALINFLLDPKNAAENTVYSKFLCPNLKAYPYLPKKLRESPILFPSTEEKKKIELVKYLGKKTKLYLDEWDEVKSSD